MQEELTVEQMMALIQGRLPAEVSGEEPDEISIEDAMQFFATAAPQNPQGQTYSPQSQSRATAAPVGSQGIPSSIGKLIQPQEQPIQGTITQKFDTPVSYTSSGRHGGLDIAAPLGTVIPAKANGQVLYIEDQGDNDYGKTVVVQGEDGKLRRYAHLNEFKVKQGQRIKAGEIIGTVGSSGRSTGPHLHYEEALPGGGGNEQYGKGGGVSIRNVRDYVNQALGLQAAQTGPVIRPGNSYAAIGAAQVDPALSEQAPQYTLGRVAGAQTSRPEMITPPTAPRARIALPQDLKKAIAFAANKYNIDPKLLAGIAYKESNFRPRNEDGGGKGRGYFQIDLGQHPHITEAQANDPVFAAEYATKLLLARMKRYQNTDDAIAAYNGNPRKPVPRQYAQAVKKILTDYSFE